MDSNVVKTDRSQREVRVQYLPLAVLTMLTSPGQLQLTLQNMRQQSRKCYLPPVSLRDVLQPEWNVVAILTLRFFHQYGVS